MTYQLRHLITKTDLPLLAEWFTILEDQVNTAAGLAKYFEQNKDFIHCQVAENSAGEILGFSWAKLDQFQPGKAYMVLFVLPDHRNMGIGSSLFNELDHFLLDKGCREIKSNVPEESKAGLAFMTHRGFEQTLHSIAMRLDLETFDDTPYQAVISQLEHKGFRFTNMEELGNTEEAQQKLYTLNDTTVMDTPLWTGGHCWDTFEEFQHDVCNQDWYQPGGQMVVIDESNGEWVAMSAITRFEDSIDAYNLFTGVDSRYRGQKLAQAVKVLALRYARDVLKTPGVRTNHNTANSPMIAIDRKFGYVQLPGYFALLKKV